MEAKSGDTGNCLGTVGQYINKHKGIIQPGCLAFYAMDTMLIMEWTATNHHHYQSVNYMKQSVKVLESRWTYKYNGRNADDFPCAEWILYENVLKVHDPSKNDKNVYNSIWKNVKAQVSHPKSVKVQDRNKKS